MKFILTELGMKPTDGAIIPHLLGESKEAALEAATVKVLEYVGMAGSWFLHFGAPILSEIFIIIGMFCIVLAITGSGKWLSRSARSFIVSMMFGMVNLTT